MKIWGTLVMFNQDVEYDLKLNLHSKIMLAFRYGIAVDKENVLGQFRKYDEPSPTKSSSGRVKCIFHIEGIKVKTVMEGNIIITALPLKKNGPFDVEDAKAMAVGFDFALCISPTLYTMQEIVDWRDKYLTSNGGITKDHLRRAIKKLAPDQRDPMEILGLHDLFFDEVKELRYLAEIEALQLLLNNANSLDLENPGGPQEVEVDREVDRLRRLAKSDRTTLYEETPEYDEEQKKDCADWVSTDEYKREMQEEHDERIRTLRAEIDEDKRKDNGLRREALTKPKPEPVLGVPFGGERFNGCNKDDLFYYHKDCVVTRKNKSAIPNGWHHIYYENENKRFITTTKQTWIFDTYEEGQSGVWTSSTKDGKTNYIQPFGGSRSSPS